MEGGAHREEGALAGARDALALAPEEGLAGREEGTLAGAMETAAPVPVREGALEEQEEEQEAGVEERSDCNEFGERVELRHFAQPQLPAAQPSAGGGDVDGWWSISSRSSW